MIYIATQKMLMYDILYNLWTHIHDVPKLVYMNKTEDYEDLEGPNSPAFTTSKESGTYKL